MSDLQAENDRLTAERDAAEDYTGRVLAGARVERIKHRAQLAAVLGQRDEVLAALKDAEHVIWYENSTEYPELLAKLQAVIAKAENRE